MLEDTELAGRVVPQVCYTTARSPVMAHAYKPCRLSCCPAAHFLKIVGHFHLPVFKRFVAALPHDIFCQGHILAPHWLDKDVSIPSEYAGGRSPPDYFGVAAGHPCLCLELQVFLPLPCSWLESCSSCCGTFLFHTRLGRASPTSSIW